ncbi:hypothetical protein [Bradyrhizobium sp. sGM-13]|uniref:hypothetical protein n=1 Tax=Bradyrhizobium sp. sGM-13 TaxID=2831781 RepID=UPI001BD130E6|nr:hypothetical protein [Bradyrhizobium sp. sGM-13]
MKRLTTGILFVSCGNLLVRLSEVRGKRDINVCRLGGKHKTRQCLHKDQSGKRHRNSGHELPPLWRWLFLIPAIGVQVAQSSISMVKNTAKRKRVPYQFWREAQDRFRFPYSLNQVLRIMRGL